MGSKQHLLATYSHIFCKMLLKIAVYQLPFPHAALLLQCTSLGMMYKLTRYLHSSIVFSRANRAMVSSIKIIASTASRPINSSVVSVLIHFSPSPTTVATIRPLRCPSLFVYVAFCRCEIIFPSIMLFVSLPNIHLFPTTNFPRSTLFPLSKSCNISSKGHTKRAASRERFILFRSSTTGNSMYKNRIMSQLTKRKTLVAISPLYRTQFSYVLYAPTSNIPTHTTMPTIILTCE